jgi:hypothetical protein
MFKQAFPLNNSRTINPESDFSVYHSDGIELTLSIAALLANFFLF